MKLNNFLHFDSSHLSTFQRITDLTVVVFAYSISLLINSESWNLEHIFICMLAILILNLSTTSSSIYSSWRGRSLLKELKLVSFYWILTFFLSYLIGYLVLTLETKPFSVFLNWFSASWLMLCSYRVLLRFTLKKLRQVGFSHRNVVIAGAGDLGIKLKSVISKDLSLGLEFKGFYDDFKSESDVEGTLEKLIEHCKEKKIDRLFITLPMRAEERIKWLMNELSETTVSVYLVPDIFTFHLLHSRTDVIAGIPAISIYDSPMSGANRVIKAIEDKVLAFIILLIISPVLLFVAAGVKASSPGPVFYRQERVSWNGKTFMMLKFRSMPVNNEKDGITWGGAQSKTNSRFGQFIRATSLDELPQFINVLLGDMSIVGPRPERTIFVEQFKKEIPRYMQKHMVKAGITGWAQINGWRGDTDLQKRVDCDLYYIDNWSLTFDLKIIFLTIFKGFIHKNAK